MTHTFAESSWLAKSGVPHDESAADLTLFHPAPLMGKAATSDCEIHTPLPLGAGEGGGGGGGGGGGLRFFTVTVTGALLLTFPALSRATAART
jgi:hypothetical protein